jgi:hypothetical protein
MGRRLAGIERGDGIVVIIYGSDLSAELIREGLARRVHARGGASVGCTRGRRPSSSGSLVDNRWVSSR